jgi:hypothetical protein
MRGRRGDRDDWDDWDDGDDGDDGKIGRRAAWRRYFGRNGYIAEPSVVAFLKWLIGRTGRKTTLFKRSISKSKIENFRSKGVTFRRKVRLILSYQAKKRKDLP